MQLNKIKIFHARGIINYSNWIENKEIVDNIEDADLVWFEGGEDVDPSLYDETKHPSTNSNLTRDLKEIEIFNKAKELGIKCIGTCRGAQLLCVLSGGRLIQHQPNPSYIHKMIAYDGKIINVSSTHHQAQYPFSLVESDDYKVLGWTENMLDFHEDGSEYELDPPLECEVVYYPKTQCLGIQPHPEMLFADYRNRAKEGFEETIEWFRELFNKFINNEL